MNLLRICQPLAVALALLALPLTGPAARAADPSKPNVVFILADDLGWTDLGCQGSKYYETPNIDRLAAQGLRFTNGYTCGPNCQPTRAALLSGQYGPRTGVYTVGSIDRFNWQSRPLRPVDNVTQLPLDRTTFAQPLKAAGYATGYFGKWHLGQQGQFHPARRGFDEAITSMGQHFDFATQPKVDYPPGTYLADFLTDKAVDFVRRHKDRPFLLCLTQFVVHSPHVAKDDLLAKFRPKPAVGGHRNPTYAAMIASLDESVGRVLAVLDELKLAENTLVIFTSDNGGVGGYVREGVKQAGDITDNAPLRGGKGMLYEGGIRVPYLFRWPGTVAAGATCDQPINSVDLYPTLLELAGTKLPDGQPLDGASYVRLLKNGGQGTLDRDAIYWHFPGYLGAGAGNWRTTPAGAIRRGDWKLLEFFETNRVELYNLKDDLGERKNLAAARPELTRELRDKLHAWRTAVKAPMPTPNPGK
jgi:arylsulfatase A-like enzyme